MSFLNQLKTQAKAMQVQRADNQQQLAAYTASLQKACDLLQYYLQELARNLSVLEPPSPPFTLDGKTPWPAMKLVNFRADTRRKMVRHREAFDTVSMGWDIVPQIGKPVGGVVSVNFPPDLKRVESRLALGPVQHERK